jgi:hypothetical protein
MVEHSCLASAVLGRVVVPPMFLGEPVIAVASGWRLMLCIAETNRIHLVLFGVQNRTLRPYLTTIHRILILGMVPAAPLCCAVLWMPAYAKSSLSGRVQQGAQAVLFGMQNRTLRPYWEAIDMICSSGCVQQRAEAVHRSGLWTFVKANVPTFLKSYFEAQEFESFDAVYGIFDQVRTAHWVDTRGFLGLDTSSEPSYT